MKSISSGRLPSPGVDDNAIIVGQAQNTPAEVNSACVAGHGIRVARRIRGSGAVYHDLGNLNFTFIQNVEHIDSADMQQFAEPVLSALQGMDLPAVLSGRNDLTIAGKISRGPPRPCTTIVCFFTAPCCSRAISRCSPGLNLPLNTIQARGIPTIRSRVTNIQGHLRQDLDVFTFCDRFCRLSMPVNR